MKIEVVCHNNNSRLSQIENAICILNGLQNYYFFDLIFDSTFDNDEATNDLYINWEIFSNRNISAEVYKIFITEKPLDDNWFSHEDNRISLISTADWEDFYSPPSLCSYVIYQIAQASINFQTDLTEQMSLNMVHDQAQGCMFDFCMQKKDIKIGMVAGSICPRCKSILQSYGTETAAISATEKILNYVRLESIGKHIAVNAKSAFIVMRFTKNDENYNAYKYGICVALKELGIRCNIASDTVISGSILKKVYQSIKDSRFIIVKVDNDSLNVFFELGLALGLDKDVLLVSEKDLVTDLPVDLNNWECLTYTRGDYEELKNKIIKYYHDNYYY